MKNPTLKARKACSIACALSSLVLLGGCKVKTFSSTSVAPRNSSSSSKTDPTDTSISRDGRPLLGIARMTWLSEIPAQPMTAKKGDIVVAAIPSNKKGVHLMVSYVNEVKNDLATITEIEHPSKMGEVGIKPNTFSNLPGSLVFPAPAEPHLKVGDWAIGLTPSRDVVLGRVLDVKEMKDREKYSIRYFDGAFKTEKETPVFALSGKIAPLQPVTFQEKVSGKSRTQLGFYLTTVGANARVLNDKGSAFQEKLTPLSALKPYKMTNELFKPSQVVEVYSGRSGYVPGTIKEVEKPGLSYWVDCDIPTSRTRLNLLPQSLI